MILRIDTKSEMNQRGSHWPKTNRAAAARETIHVALPMHLRAAGFLGPRGMLSNDAGWLVTLTRIAPSAGLDDDNLRSALKACRDQVADELGLPSDRDPRVTWAYEQRRGSRKDLTLAKGYGVCVEISSRP